MSEKKSDSTEKRLSAHVTKSSEFILNFDFSSFLPPLPAVKASYVDALSAQCDRLMSQCLETCATLSLAPKDLTYFLEYSVSSIMKDMFRRPRKEYLDASEFNESKSPSGKLPADAWLIVFGFLDENSLMMLMRSGKKFANLANDEHTRRRLYAHDQRCEVQHQLPFFCAANPENTLREKEQAVMASLPTHLRNNFS